MIMMYIVIAIMIAAVASSSYLLSGHVNVAAKDDYRLHFRSPDDMLKAHQGGEGVLKWKQPLAVYAGCDQEHDIAGKHQTS